MTTVPKLGLTKPEAAEAAGVKPATIGRAIASGALRAKKTGKNGGGNHIIRIADLEAWLDSLEDA